MILIRIARLKCANMYVLKIAVKLYFLFLTTETLRNRKYFQSTKGQ